MKWTKGLVAFNAILLVAMCAPDRPALASFEDGWWPTAGEYGITEDHLMDIPREPFGPFAPWYDPESALGKAARNRGGKRWSRHRPVPLDFSQASEVSETVVAVDSGGLPAGLSASGASGRGARQADRSTVASGDASPTDSGESEARWWIPFYPGGGSGDGGGGGGGDAPGSGGAGSGSATVPLPGSVLLLGSGLAGLAWLRGKSLSKNPP